MNVEHEEEDLTADDSYARGLFEAGDLGLLPGGRYPVLGNGEYSQRLRAILGASEGEHLRGLDEQAQREYPDRHIRKHRRRPRTPVHCSNERLISAAKYRDLYSGLAFANSMGAVLNTHITLTWPLLGYQDDTDASRALQDKFIKPMREWFRDQADHMGRPFAWVYAHERSKSMGLHTHFLVAVPLELKRAFIKWFGQRKKRLSKSGSVEPKAVYLSDIRVTDPFFHQWRQFGYLMKSVDPRAYLPEFEGSDSTVPIRDLVPWALEGPGEVNCKLRVGIAQEIGAPARARAQYRSLLERGITDVRLLFGDYDFKRWQLARWIRECEIAGERGADLIGGLERRRSMVEEDFRIDHAAWLRMVKERDREFREMKSTRAAQLKAVGELFGHRTTPWAPCRAFGVSRRAPAKSGTAPGHVPAPQ